MEKAVFNKETHFTNKLDSVLRKKRMKCDTWSTALYGTGNGTLRYIDQKYIEFKNVVLENNGEDKLDRSCEKRRSITNSQRRKEHPAVKIDNVRLNVTSRHVPATIVAVLKQ